MKIDSAGIKQITLPTSTDSRPARPQAGVPADAGQTGVSLSPRAEQLKQMETQMAAIPVVDRARVDSIKAAIANGEYVIKPENIAAGLFDSVREFINASR